MNGSRLAETLRSHDLAGVIATTPENVAYLSGFHTGEPGAGRSGGLYAVASADAGQAPCAVLPALTLSEAAQLDLALDRVWCYGEFHVVSSASASVGAAARAVREWFEERAPASEAIDALVSALRQLDLLGTPIGIDDTGLCRDELAALEERIGAPLVPFSDGLRHVRARKTEEEVARLRRASATAERAVARMLEMARPGRPHRELVMAYREAVVEAEAVPTHANIRFGPDGGLPFLRPSTVELRRGDLVAWDVGLVLDQYHADTARCAAVGRPADRRAARYYEALVAGQQAAIAAVRPGATASELHERAVGTVRAEGISHYERVHCGHGIGLANYDDPLLAPGSDAPIEAGMVLNVETPYYELGLGSPIVEDTVVVTDDGVEYLTHRPRELVEL